ncbi:MAG: cytochrome c3 family protein [Acidobacteriota bacterium]
MRSISVSVAFAAAILTLTPPLAAEITQPIAYSHKQHIGMGLTCLDCHITADTAAAATIPSVTKCMLCHAKLGKDKPEIKKVAAYAGARREIPWQRVYQFSSQALVKFRHAPHVTKGIACATCHGDMAIATTAQKLVSHTMGTCLTCHRQNHASEDCATCHY